MEAWRAGFWPAPAASTWPMITSPTWAGSTLARASASLMTAAPRSTAGILASEPPNLPTAVRTAETMTMSSMRVSFGNRDGGRACDSLRLGLHVAAGRRLDRLVFRALAVGLGRGNLLARQRLQPAGPVGPPAAGVLLRAFEPLLVSSGQ